VGWRKYDRQYQHLLPVHLSCKVKAGTDYMSSMHKPWTKTTIEPETSAQTHAACTWEQRTGISNLVTRDFVALNEKRITSSSLPSKEKRFDCLLESVDAGNFQGPSFEWLNRRVWHIGLCCGARQSRWMSRWDEGIYWMGVLYRSGKWKIEASSYICFWSGRFLISWNRRSQVCKWAHSSVRNTVEVKKDHIQCYCNDLTQ